MREGRDRSQGGQGRDDQRSPLERMRENREAREKGETKPPDQEQERKRDDRDR